MSAEALRKLLGGTSSTTTTSTETTTTTEDVTTAVDEIFHWEAAVLFLGECRSLSQCLGQIGGEELTERGKKRGVDVRATVLCLPMCQSSSVLGIISCTIFTAHCYCLPAIAMSIWAPLTAPYEVVTCAP